MNSETTSSDDKATSAKSAMSDAATAKVADAKSKDETNDSTESAKVEKSTKIAKVAKSAKPAKSKPDVADPDSITTGVAVSATAIKTLRMHDKDVGSSQVQIAKLTARILHLTEHLRTHKKDNHTRRGLIAMISRRRKLTAYLKRVDLPTHRQVLSTLGLRK